MPADDQAIALPCASVIVIIVLLKLAFTWATPAVMFLRSRLLRRCGACAMLPTYPCIFEPVRAEPVEALSCLAAAGRRTVRDYFFFPAIGLALPLRVRALVCVRWPRTGRPFL